MLLSFQQTDRINFLLTAVLNFTTVLFAPTFLEERVHPASNCELSLAKER